MADVELRTLQPPELPAVLRLDELVWGNNPDPDRDRFNLEYLEADRMVGAFDGAELVAAQGTVTLRMTVPGGAQIGLAGATWLLVHPLYRGRGLMHRLDAAARALIRPDEPVYGGMPHEPASRAGDEFGTASRYADVELQLDRHRSVRAAADSGGLEYVPFETALAAMREVAGRLSGSRNGWVPRKPCADAYKYGLWSSGSGGYGPINFVVHHDGSGAADGFLSYQLDAYSGSQSRPDGTIRVIELLATSAEVEAALWAHCVHNRVAYRLVALRRPVDDPLPWRLADPRDLSQTVRDDLHMTVLDVPAALSARRYAREDTVVVEVAAITGWPRGLGDAVRVRLSGGLDGAECVPVSDDPDLTVSRRALAAAYLGDTPLLTLAAAGQVSEHTPGSLRRASAMFSWSPAPWLQDIF